MREIAWHSRGQIVFQTGIRCTTVFESARLRVDVPPEDGSCVFFLENWIVEYREKLFSLRDRSGRRNMRKTPEIRISFGDASPDLEMVIVDEAGNGRQSVQAFQGVRTILVAENQKIRIEDSAAQPESQPGDTGAAGGQNVSGAGSAGAAGGQNGKRPKGAGAAGGQSVSGAGSAEAAGGPNGKRPKGAGASGGQSVSGAGSAGAAGSQNVSGAGSAGAAGGQNVSGAGSTGTAGGQNVSGASGGQSGNRAGTGTKAGNRGGNHAGTKAASGSQSGNHRGAEARLEELKDQGRHEVVEIMALQEQIEEAKRQLASLRTLSSARRQRYEQQQAQLSALQQAQRQMEEQLQRGLEEQKRVKARLETCRKRLDELNAAKEIDELNCQEAQRQLEALSMQVQADAASVELVKQDGGQESIKTMLEAAQKEIEKAEQRLGRIIRIREKKNKILEDVILLTGGTVDAGSQAQSGGSDA